MNKIIVKSAFLAGFLLVAFASCNQTPAILKGKKASEPVNLHSSVEVTDIPVNLTGTSENLSDQDKSKLLGRWLRSDGNYLLEIFSITQEGKVNAGYFNPNPINVEKAEWIIKENRLIVCVILRDVNYPGSTYTLEYLPGNDSLTGNYFLGGEGTNYDVVFTRKKH